MQILAGVVVDLKRLLVEVSIEEGVDGDQQGDFFQFPLDFHEDAVFSEDEVVGELEEDVLETGWGEGYLLRKCLT
jgi:hypothetical protein